MAEIHDFGEKIGGARKDLWSSRGLLLTDLDEMSITERTTHIKKDNVWPKPDWEQQITEGKPQLLVYWQNKMRQSVPPKPPKDTEESQRNYVEVVGALRDAVMAVKDPNGIDSFYKDYLRKNYVNKGEHSYYVTIEPNAEGIITNKVLKAAQASRHKMKSEAEKKLFGIPKDEQIYTQIKTRLSVHQYDGKDVCFESDPRRDDHNILTVGTPFSKSYYYLYPGDPFYDKSQWETGKYFVMDNGRRQPLKLNFETVQEARDFIEAYAREKQQAENERAAESKKGTGKKRKTPFVPPQLQNIKRTGPDYRNGKAADSDLFLDELKFRGGEFGNWLNHEDRQASLDMAYDALRDLARILHIRPEDISLEGTLAIAFGARGKGGANAAAAHYEPERQVINLTKMSGAGCLAHEWAHALDHAIGLSYGATGLASENKSSRMPETLRDLLDSLKYKKVIIPAEEISAEMASKLVHSKRNLNSWIKSVKPSNLSDDLEKAWDNAAKSIVEAASTFTGVEYMTLGRKDKVITKPEIEMLSQIRKLATNRTIPRDTKRQIAMWASEVKRREESIQSSQPQERMVKTDFYKGSIEFDSTHSRAGHGYYQSECEMFARAFDCYMSDQIKVSGLRSEYLTAYANSFVITGKEGNPTAAIPLGEERELINGKFDLLFEELKQRGLLHDFEEVLEHTQETPCGKLTLEAMSGEFPHEERSTRYEQLSLDELIFSAGSRTENAASFKPVSTKQHSR